MMMVTTPSIWAGDLVGQAWLARDISTGVGVFSAGLPVTVAARAAGVIEVDMGAVQRAYLPPEWVSDQAEREALCRECHLSALPRIPQLCPGCLAFYARRGLIA